MKITKLVVSFFTCLALNATAYAVIVDRGTYLSDTGTNLDWLDVTATTNRSYEEILALTQPGQLYSQWQIATADQLLELVSNFTNQTTPYGNYDPITYTDFNLVQQLISMLGDTYRSGNAYMGTPVPINGNYGAFSFYYKTTGYVSVSPINPLSPLEFYVSSILSLDDPIDTNPPLAWLYTRDWGHTFAMYPADPFRGTFLVKASSTEATSVPEPASIILLGVGFLGMLVARRSRKMD